MKWHWSGSRADAMVRAFRLSLVARFRVPRLADKCGLRLLIFYSAPRFFSVRCGFPLLLKTKDWFNSLKPSWNVERFMYLLKCNETNSFNKVHEKIEVRINKFDTSNRPFCRYGGHFDFYCFRRHYGMLRGQINMYLPPGHPIIAIRNNRNQNGRRIGKKVYLGRRKN